MEDHKVKLTVIKSECPKYKIGDEIHFNGAFIDKENSSELCMVALNAVYPFVYAVRRGGQVAIKKGSIQCPDCTEAVEFQVDLDE